jgi:hypothetical protein
MAVCLVSTTCPIACIRGALRSRNRPFTIILNNPLLPRPYTSVNKLPSRDNNGRTDDEEEDEGCPTIRRRQP